MEKYYIGFDAGTQSVKVALYKEDMECITDYSTPTVFNYPHEGWVEMDIDQYVVAVKEGIKSCMSVASEKGIKPEDVKAICGDGIICGIAGIDEDFNAITPYINYLDSRTNDDVEYIKSLGHSIWAEETGNPEPNCLFPAMFARWFYKNDKEFGARGKKFVHNAPYVLAKLAGLKAKDAFIDWGAMSGWGLGYDIYKKQWSQKQLDILEIDMEHMPQIRKPWDIVGRLDEETAKELGLAAGTAVCGGAGDTMQSMLGCGLTDSGLAADVAGTCAMFCVSTDGIVPELSRPETGLIFNSGTLENSYFYWGFIRAGGLSLTWFRDNVCNAKGDNGYYDQLSEKASLVPPGSNGVQFLPYLTGGVGDYSSGCFLNMHMDTDQAVMWRSVLEAIGYEYIGVADQYKSAGVELSRIIITEGGSRSELWNQIKADMLDCTTVTLEKQGGAIMSNIAVAKYATGDVPDLKKEFLKWIEEKKVYKSDKKNHEYYSKVYELKRKLVEQDMVDPFETLNRINNEKS